MVVDLHVGFAAPSPANISPSLRFTSGFRVSSCVSGLLELQGRAGMVGMLKAVFCWLLTLRVSGVKGAAC